MADVPPPTDATDSNGPDSLFLDALWDRLEQAQALASSSEVMAQLPEVLRLCEEAAALIRGRA